MKTKLKYLFVSAAIFGALSCSDTPNKDSEKALINEADSMPTLSVNREVLDEMIHTLPQPIEIADIIAKSNMGFSKDMLIPSDKSEKYPDKYYQAMAFGAYGVDLGYINLNEKSLYAIEYLESIRNLSKELKVEQFFDFQTLSELSKNKDNSDSLINLSTRNFNRIDVFLREQDRGELSVLMLMGAWIEGMHMFGEIQKTTPSADISNRIGEQKVVFENISVIIDKLGTIDHFKTMKTDFQELKAGYDKVGISYEYRQPETKEVNGELIIIDKTETKITITEADVKQIIASIEKIRSKYLMTTTK